MTNLITGLQHFGHCILVIGICLTPSLSRAEVTAERSQHGVAIKIDGKLFTEYWTKAGHEPSLYPVIGPTGKPVTRSFPFTPPGETNDHPHHQSLWMTHGMVNDVDFWGTNRNDDKGDQGPHIAHREFVTMKS